MSIYKIYSGAQPTASKLVAIATGTAIKTLLQIKSSTTKTFKIKEWGISFNGSAAAEPLPVELIETGTVFATVTAHVESGIVKVDGQAMADGNPTTDLIPVGVSATGYNATAEGTVTAGRLFDSGLVAPTSKFIKQFVLGNEPVVALASALRIRVHAPATVNAICYVEIEV